MTKKNKLDDIILQIITQRVGENASKEEIARYFSKLSPENFMNLILDIDANMNHNARIGFPKEEAENHANNKESVDDKNNYEDDFFNFSGRLECMPTSKAKKYTIRIKLRYISPSIWRKIEVPSSAKLTSLAEIIITAMGWYNEHLHQFITKNRDYYATAKQDYDDVLWGRIQFWGGDYSIEHLLKKEKDKVTFEYDFGDSWEHDVILSKVEEYDDEEPQIVKLIGGKRACPPEDCGGVPGYCDLCNAMEHPYSKRARELKEWLGYKYDPEEFWLEEVQEEIDYLNQ